MSGSHYIKDENGDYHHLNDEEYGEMQHENAMATIMSIMGTGGFVLALLYVFHVPFTYIIWGGIAVIALGVLLLLAYASKGEFFNALVAILIVYALMGWGAHWLRNKLDESSEKDQLKSEKQEKDKESYIFIKNNSFSIEPYLAHIIIMSDDKEIV